MTTATALPRAEWNVTERHYPDLLLHEAFALRAADEPDAPALSFGSDRLTYAELDGRVGLAASRLLELGVGRGSLVAVCMHRSLELVVALHAVLRAGGAYVPIDPDYPDERIALMLEDLDDPIVLTQASLTERLARASARTEVLDAGGALQPPAELRAPPKVSPDDLAYVIYTSGSTGRPKGAMISHRAIANRIFWMQERYPLTSSDRVLQKTPFSFDVSVWEFFWPLLFGAELVVAEPGGHRDSAYLVRTIAEHRITTLHFVPSMLQLFLEDPGAGGCDSLRRVFCSGEALPRALQDRFFATLEAELHNLYGPTEAAVDVSAWACDPQSSLGFVPIGTPVANTQLHILDSDMRPLPVGTAGELYIGGVQVGLGYLKRPELTAERFLPDPFRDGGTLYRTGDLARYLPDGNIEFLGRSDFQVKIRGFRVELGEIEAALESFEQVRGAVVVARERADGELELVAYVAHPDGEALPVTELRGHLAERLPEYMVPTLFVGLDRFPLSANGKVDRKLLPPPVRRRPDLATAFVPPRSKLAGHIAERWRRILDLDRVGIHDRFFDLGGSSLQAARFVNQLQAELGVRIPVASLFGAPSIAAYVDYLQREHPAAVAKLGAEAPVSSSGVSATNGSGTEPVSADQPAEGTPRPEPAPHDGVAIVGMAGRFPGAGNVDALWAHLCEGVESVGPLSAEQLRSNDVDASDPSFVNAAGGPDDLEAFDAAFFGMGRREAELTDPQHRLVLETAWAALEHAGCDPARFDGRIGIFGGVAANQYLRQNLLTRPELLDRSGFYPVLIASEREYAITRAAFLFGLRGPAVPVMTACSTSAVATHLAVRSLLASESDMALAGGAHVNLLGRHGYLYQEDGILSRDGHVRAFDADAQGTVMSSGAAFIVLKRLEDALADRDTVYAVIRGSAVNNDGAARVGFTAPSTEGQAAVIDGALTAADIDADTIGLLESHGTGTSLGDPIEVEALTRAYRRHTDRRGYCAISSVKSNIGHLDAAAGVASIIKAALALYHEHIPPSINFSKPNPQIDFEASPFFVNTTPLAWRRADRPRRAGVSSFGFGGTNAHLILEEAPATASAVPVAPDAPAGGRPWILPISARTPAALDERRRQLADHLASAEVEIADVAHTLSLGRAAMPERTAIVAHDLADAVEALGGGGPAAVAEPRTAVEGADVVFLFTGQGAQYAGMGASLYRHEPVFAAALDECARISASLGGPDLLEAILAEDVGAEDGDRRLLQTAVGQPSILALQVALAHLWASWGVEPAAMVGHSVGEIAAACVGGGLSLGDALGLAIERGSLMQALPEGAMTAVLATADRVTPLLDERVSLAAVNDVEQCVASGPPPAIDELERRLEATGVLFRRLPTDRAFHSPMMEPVLEPLRARLERIQWTPLRIPLVSTVTAAWTSNGSVAEADYWVRHARGTVRFADAVELLLHDRPGSILIEIGPGSVLTSLVDRHPGLGPEAATIATLPQRGEDTDDRLHAYRALARAWTAGAAVDWVALNGGRGRSIALPTYPFARDRYWIDPADRSERTEGSPSGASARRLAPAIEATDPEVTPSDEPRDRRERIAAEVAAIVVDLSGLEPAEIDHAASFTDLGFDSLFLTQLNTQLKRRFGVRVTLNQLLQETPSIDALAARIDEEAPPAALTPPQRPAGEHADEGARTDTKPDPMAPIITGDGSPDGAPGDDEVDRLMATQLRIMEQQIELLRAQMTADGRPTSRRSEHAGGDS